MNKVLFSESDSSIQQLDSMSSELELGADLLDYNASEALKAAAAMLTEIIVSKIES